MKNYLDIPWRIRLTIESSILCCDWSEFHKWAEMILGHPIWTHEFGIDETNLNLKIALIINDEDIDYKFNREKTPLETLMEIA